MILINFNFVDMWNGRVYITAVDYDRYAIVKPCYFSLNESKFTPCECFKYGF